MTIDSAFVMVELFYTELSLWVEMWITNGDNFNHNPGVYMLLNIRLFGNMID